MALAALLEIPAVRAFLFDGKVLSNFRRVAKKYNIDAARAEEFLDLSNAIMDEKLGIGDVPVLLAEAFKLDQPTSEHLAADILGYQFLPLETFFPKVKEQIVAWGGKIEDYPVAKIEKEKITSLNWAARLVEGAEITFSDVLMKRLAFLLEGRLAGEKSTDDLRTFFGRALSIGGLGLVKEQNDRLMAEVEAALPYVQIISEEEMKKIEAERVAEESVAEEEPDEPEEQLPEVTPSHELAAEVPVVNVPHVSEEKPDDLAVKKAKQLSGEKGAELRQAFEKAVDAALESATDVLKKKKITEKAFADIAGKAIRGVRDLEKTRNVFEVDLKLSPNDTKILLDAIKQGTDIYNTKNVDEDVPEEVAEAIQESEAMMMDKRFAKLTHADVQKPKPVRAELTVGSVAPKTDGPRKLTDVVAATRLVTPADQLKTMSTTEFRRLSSDPEQAAQKIEDLLSALEATSYEDKVKGIKAWRASPMNQLYISMAEEALQSGISVPEVASKRRASNKESLSPAEMKALVSLNARLRF